MTTRPLALVIGATGGIGGEVTQAMLRRGWRVRALARKPPTATPWFGTVEWHVGDAMLAADVIGAVAGARVIVHAANPPGYRNWRGLAVPILANAIAAARASGARLVVPGNVYNYGPDAFPVLSETSPQHPISRKGAIRVEMEGMLRDAARDGVQSVVIRAGDFFGAHQPASWFADMVVRRGRPVRRATYPGTHGVGHAWAYLPDLAETFARVIEREAELPAFETFHFGGHWLDHGEDFARAVLRVAGQPEDAIRPAPWLLFTLLSPFVTFLRETREMRYLWTTPVRLDNRKLVALLGEEPHTPLEQALRQVLGELGCLPAGPAAGLPAAKAA
jgi:nucleoside-diphosphate-sugar epimerase